MAIGNPITLTSNVASKTISVIATAGQTLFTVTGGYRINQLAVFRNGVRLLDSRDYEARNGATVTLLSAATVGDALEFQVFDDFRVADAIVSAESEQTISGNLIVSGILTATDLRPTDLSLRHLKATGISTVSDTTQSTSTTSGAMIVSGGLGVAKNLFVGGSMNVAGTLTYEDVTNSETAGITTTGGLVVTGLGATFGSISTHFSNVEFGAAGVGGTITPLGHAGFTGIVTALGFQASGVVTAVTFDGNVTGNISGGTVAGSTGTFTSDVDIADKIVHTGDTNTAIRFPAADTFTVETAGSEALRITSNGDLMTGGITSGAGKVQVGGGLRIAGSATHTDTNSPYLYRTSGADNLCISTTALERLRIDSSGRVIIGTNSGSGNITLKLQGHSGNSTQDAKIRLCRGSDSPSDTNQLGAIFFSDNSESPSADIIAIRDGGTWSGSSKPGALKFATTADGDASSTERLRITSAGKIGIGNVSSPDNNIEVRTASNDEGILIKSTGSTSNALTFDANRSGAGNGLGAIRGKWNGTTVGQITFLAGADTTNKDDGVITFGTESAASNGNANASEKLRIDKDGKVHIGDSASNANGHGLLSLTQNAQAAFNALVIQQGNTLFTATDGLHIGIDANVDAYIKTFENRDIYFTTGATNTEKLRINNDGSIVPGSNDAQDLGSTSLRWANIFTADLQLSNETKKDIGGNDVDGTWGDYTIQEGENDLFLLNRRNGKKFKFMLQEVS